MIYDYYTIYFYNESNYVNLVRMCWYRLTLTRTMPSDIIPVVLVVWQLIIFVSLIYLVPSDTILIQDVVRCANGVLGTTQVACTRVSVQYRVLLSIMCKISSFYISVSCYRVVDEGYKWLRLNIGNIHIWHNN